MRHSLLAAVTTLLLISLISPLVWATDAAAATSGDNTVSLCSKEKDFGSDRKFCYDFLVGAEGTSVSSLNSKTNVRTEFTGYQTMRWGKAWTQHIWGNLLFTSTGEQSAASSTSATTTTTTTPPASQNTAVEGNINFGVFAPWHLDDHGLRFGIIGTWGTRKASGDSIFNKRTYGGFRLARSPNQYLDLIFGSSQGVDGPRVEFRAQMPIGNVFLGMQFNDAIHKGQAQSADTIKLYIVAPVDVTKIFTTIGK